MRLNLVAVAYALWLVATEFLFYYVLGDDQSIVMEISVLLGLILPLCNFFSWALTRMGSPRLCR